MRLRIREPLIQECDLGKILLCILVNGVNRQLHSKPEKPQSRARLRTL
jgi:hypothetical protein